MFFGSEEWWFVCPGSIVDVWALTFRVVSFVCLCARIIAFCRWVVVWVRKLLPFLLAHLSSRNCGTFGFFGFLWFFFDPFVSVVIYYGDVSYVVF